MAMVMRIAMMTTMRMVVMMLTMRMAMMKMMHGAGHEDEGDESDDGGDDHILPFPTRCTI